MWAESEEPRPLCLGRDLLRSLSSARPLPFLLFIWQWNKVPFAIYHYTYLCSYFLTGEFSKIFLSQNWNIKVRGQYIFLKKNRRTHISYSDWRGCCLFGVRTKCGCVRKLQSKSLLWNNYFGQNCDTYLKLFMNTKPKIAKTYY